MAYIGSCDEFCNILLSKKEKYMNDIVVQGLLWAAAAGCLLLYMKRRRNRKVSS
jgi:hypothetical protein